MSSRAGVDFMGKEQSLPLSGIADYSLIFYVLDVTTSGTESRYSRESHFLGVNQ
jgi:hypothetical protein